MTPGKFLRLIWSDVGPYCIAHPFKIPGTDKVVYAHKVFDTISEAVTHVHEQANLQDVFFAVLTLDKRQVWDPEKVDYKTGLKGAYAVRLQSNMAKSKALFFDLDVGEEDHKFDSREDALKALAEFLLKTKLPVPTLVSSGGGVHVYWHIAEAVERDDCRRMQWHMRQLADGLGLKVDPQRTTDMSSVLRVPDTLNWKDRNNPRPVKVLGGAAGAVTPVATLQQIISDAMIANGITATEPEATYKAGAANQVPNPLGEQAAFADFGPPQTLSELGDACAQVREMIRSQTDTKHPSYGPFDNNAWYRGMLATLKHVENGDDLCRKLTALHPRSVSDIEAKLQQLERYAPAKCTTLQQVMPWKDSPCQGCPHRDKVPNPFVAARRTTPAPPPMVSSVPPLPPGAPTSTSPQPPYFSVAPVQLLAPNVLFAPPPIPNPPKPWERLLAGGISLTRKDKDGNDSITVIFPHDLYPLKRMENKDEKREQQVWRVVLPRTGARDFTIDADVLYDSRKFTSALAHNGIYPNKADIPALQDYMVAYISQLQKTLDADTQSGHLGWIDDYRQFVLPDKILSSDGSVKPATLSIAAERAAQHIKKRGDANVQRALLDFFNRPEYVANQFVILSSLASVIFDMTGHHGIVVNCSGDAGASKSTTLYTAASLWGDTVNWPINGTNRGATANARMQRIATNANLPTCVDEITHMPAKEAIDLVMSITQPGHRLRLTTEGVERKVEENYKSAIMIATANSSLHSLISQDSAAGTAGSMRVFEIKFPVPNVHTKPEADAFLRQIKENFGHIGELFVHFVITNRERVAKRVHKVMEEIDAEAGIRSSERFWSAVIAVVIVAAEICEALRLLPYSSEAIRKWAVEEQVPYMRGVVKEEYRDPLAVLTDYIAEKHGNIVVIDKSTTIGANTAGQAVAADTSYAIKEPHGALLGHYDLKAGTLLLMHNAFKEHCSRIGASATKILEELSSGPSPVVLKRQVRRTLGAGTNLAKGQTWCILVDMNNPEVAGVKPTLAVSNPAPANDAGVAA